jgi:hypothetical protein
VDLTEYLYHLLIVNNGHAMTASVANDAIRLHERDRT